MPPWSTRTRTSHHIYVGFTHQTLLLCKLQYPTSSHVVVDHYVSVSSLFLFLSLITVSVACYLLLVRLLRSRRFLVHCHTGVIQRFVQQVSAGGLTAAAQSGLLPVEVSDETHSRSVRSGQHSHTHSHIHMFTHTKTHIFTQSKL